MKYKKKEKKKLPKSIKRFVWQFVGTLSFAVIFFAIYFNFNTFYENHKSLIQNNIKYHIDFMSYIKNIIAYANFI